MARFTVGKPISTTEPTITVDAGLALGVHRFQLEVATADGRVSRPDVAEVTVVRSILTPVQPLEPLRPVIPGE